jgi:hypothetical protein
MSLRSDIIFLFRSNQSFLLHLNAAWESEKQHILILYSFSFTTSMQFLFVDTVFQILWFLSGCPWKRIADNMEATEKRVPGG